MTRLASIIREQHATYTSVAERANLQPRTVRLLATGETPIDSVAVGTVRRIADALAVPVADLLAQEDVLPGDPSLARAGRLSAAIRQLMWPNTRTAYASPVEPGPRDGIADVPPDDFFAGMTPVDARRG